MQLPTSNIEDHMELIAKVVSKCAYTVLELGTEYGTGSTQAIRCGFERRIGDKLKSGVIPDPVWVSVDIRDIIPQWIRPNWPWWRMVVGDSRDEGTAKQVESILGHRMFDFIFVDTIHTPEFVSKELPLWSTMADTKSCVWLFHDVWMNGRYNPMTDVIKEFAEKTGRWRYEELSKDCNGIGAYIPLGKTLAPDGSLV